MDNSAREEQEEQQKTGTTITELELHAIDVLVNAGTPTECSVQHTDVDQFDEEIRAAGFLAYAALPDYQSRRPYERSLWCMRADGRCVPEIFLLATIRYGVLSDVVPKWADGNATNNCKANVVLVKVGNPGVDGRVAKNKYGVPAGTPEYRKRYFSDPENRQRQQNAARKSAEKKRTEVKKAKVVLPPDDLDLLAKKILMPDGRKGTDDDRMFQRLNDPEVVKEITIQAQMLHDVAGTPMEEALVQARDNVLGVRSQVQESESEPSVLEQDREN